MFKYLIEKITKRVSFKICQYEYDSPQLTAVLSWFSDNDWHFESPLESIAGGQQISRYKVIKDQDSAILVFQTHEGVTLHTVEKSAHLFHPLKVETE